MDKSPEAFRTISEVAEALETPAHVLRFWESRFPQIRPVKRAGGRRYYRPSDVALLTGIKRLLHDEGMTIRGVQKILREQGTRHVSGLSEEPSAEEEALEAAMAIDIDPEVELAPDPTPDEAAEATAAALTAALHPEELPKETAVAMTQAELAWPEPEAAGVQAPAEDITAPAEEPAVEAVVVPFMAEPAAEPPAPPPAAAPAPEDAPAAPSVAPSVAPVESRREEVPTATLAARLRALPRGSLAAKQAELAEIAARIAALRARMGAPLPSG